MNRKINMVLSFALIVTLLSTQSLKTVKAEEELVVQNLETETTETQVTISLDQLKGLNDQITASLSDSSLNTLIKKNLSAFKTKADAMIKQDPSTLDQTEVDALSTDIELALKDVAYSATLNEIALLMELNLTTYDSSTSDNFKTTLILAKETINTIENEITTGVPLATLSKVNALLDSLNNGKSLLVLNDYTSIKEAITSAEKIKPSQYTSASQTVLKNALASAKESLTIEITSKDLKQRTLTLTEAISNLEAVFLPEQKTIMDSFVLKVKSFDDKKHSDASKKLIYDLNTKVELFLKKEVKTMEEAERLLQEISQIELLMANPDIKEPVLVDKTELKLAINKADAIKKSDHTNESWMAFQDKLEIARTVFKNESVLQEMVKMATGNLNEAMKSLTSTGTPIAHPFNDLKEFYYVGDTFTLSMGTQETLTFDETMFDVQFGKEITVKAIQAGTSQIQFKEKNGSIVKYQIEIKEKLVSEPEQDLTKPETNSPKHDDETLVDVGITPDYSVIMISSMMIIAGLFLITIKRKETNS